MLVLGRRLNESVVIGDPEHPIGVVTITGIRGDKIRLGFEGFGDTLINREEVADRLVRERRRAVVKLGPGGDFVKEWFDTAGKPG